MIHNFAFVLLLSILSSTIHNPDRPFPIMNLKTVDGKSVSTAEFVQSGKNTVICFFATWCTPCKKEMDIINDYLEEWEEKYNFQLVAITIDDARGMTKIPALIQSKGWEFAVYSDQNELLKQRLNFQTIPQTFILNTEGNIVYEHNGFQPGNEIELEEVLKSLNQ